MGTTFVLALALMLILEGVLPFLAPNLWRDTFRRITQMSDGQIRFVGLSSMLVGPPLLEYMDSLLTGTGHDLELRTFKVVDQISGRMMGLRADITPQVARIDAHLLNREGVTRLCYCGSVLHARPRGLDATREPLQIGAEVYGHAGIESDREVQGLAVQALRASGIREPRIDLGHVAIFRALCRRGGVGAELETEL